MPRYPCRFSPNNHATSLLPITPYLADLASLSSSFFCCFLLVVSTLAASLRPFSSPLTFDLLLRPRLPEKNLRAIEAGFDVDLCSSDCSTVLVEDVLSEEAMGREGVAVVVVFIISGLSSLCNGGPIEVMAMAGLVCFCREGMRSVLFEWMLLRELFVL